MVALPGEGEGGGKQFQRKWIPVSRPELRKAKSGYSAAGRNCSVSVDSFMAVVEDLPPVMAMETASK